MQSVYVLFFLVLLVGLLVDLGKDLAVLEEEVLLQSNDARGGMIASAVSSHTSARESKRRRTSSPTLIGLPPHPGRRTRSPAWTEVGTTIPACRVETRWRPGVYQLDSPFTSFTVQ